MISILMPIYNGIEFIDESVSSILNQTYSQWELLIGVNGHSENSDVYKIAKEYEKKSVKIRVYDFHNIKGKSNALNAMIQFCKYDHIALLDVDDIWHPQKLEIQSRFFNYYGIIGSNCISFGDKSNEISIIPLGDITNYDFSLVNPIINSSCIIRKEFCNWNHNWNGIEDYDLWLRLRKAGKRFYNCKEILIKHRIHNASAFNAKGNDNKVEDLLKTHNIVREGNKTLDEIRYSHLTKKKF
jgi:teichuronic acid biosynthesis glycosyltransferase TuaG